MKKKILIIGSSKSIKKLMILLFKKNYVLKFQSFRDKWQTQESKFYDTIVLSGFHYKICTLKKHDLNNYIKEYYFFINMLKKRCNKFLLITTYMNIEYSYCKVVYFYYKLILENRLLTKKKIKIYNFKKIFFVQSNKLEYLKKILLYFNFEDTMYVALNFERYRLRKINPIKFFLIKYARSRTIDRILRLL
ncbi:hypothetical protein OAO75_03115 [Candidatus Pelagibacter ubique]|nr:hypothetical protein [Candidatus Pelagibacter ubique]